MNVTSTLRRSQWSEYQPWTVTTAWNEISSFYTKGHKV